MLFGLSKIVSNTFIGHLLTLSKTSIFLFGFVKSDLLKVGHGLKQMRPINIFTGRGVRFAKQVIYKKQGKVSSYR